MSQAELSRAAEDARALAGLVRDSQRSGTQRRALLLSLSSLPPERFRPHHARLAEAALDPLADADRARRFALPNGDLAVVWRGPGDAALRRTLRALDLLFADAPSLVPDPQALVRLLALPEHAGVLLDVVDCSLRPPPPPPPPRPPRDTRPLDLAALAALETALARADMACFARRRPVCTRDDAGTWQPAWERRCLSVSELAEALAPDHDLRADPWLFRRLTRTLDRRLLALLSAPAELRDAGPFSLRLNLATVLGPEFLRFDAALPVGLRGKVTVELRPDDVLSDPAGFVFARDFLHARDHQVLVCGLTAALLPVFPAARLEADWLALRWHPDLEQCAALADAARLVLTGADTAGAVACGRRLGIAHFQGSAVTPR